MKHAAVIDVMYLTAINLHTKENKKYLNRLQGLREISRAEDLGARHRR